MMVVSFHLLSVLLLIASSIKLINPSSHKEEECITNTCSNEDNGTSYATITTESSTEENKYSSYTEKELLEAIKEHGVSQKTEGTEKEASLKVVRDTLNYMTNLEVDASLSQEIKDSCSNKHELCAFWAAIGECEANVGYMKVSCAPSCQSCWMIDFDQRCPPRDASLPPALTPGGLNAMFQRIVDNEEYDVSVLSRPNLENQTGISEQNDLDEPPWVITINNFLTPIECDTIIELGKLQGYERSRDVGPKDIDGSYKPMESSGRTSKNAWCNKECREDEMVQNILNRIENVTGVPKVNNEDFQVLQYDVGQFYRHHHDFIPHQVERACGPRILTFYQYLNDVEEGGGTAFPLLGLEVKPQRGKVLLWPSCLNSDPNKKDARMDHEALPVVKGIKYGANAWIHLYDYVTPQAQNCA